MLKHLFSGAFIIISLSLWAQNGCTDLQALNYNPDAKVNDGSCEYNPMILRPDVSIENLSPKVEETSGIIYWKDAIWTHNDSGGEAAIYKLNPVTGEIVQSVYISNGNNIDIEDITQDENYIYVGDFGNNYGNRKDLTIYKLAKADFTDEPDFYVNAEIITFSYNDQKSFERKNRSNDYDCEAMMSKDDHLYLFTKNWVTEETKCYKVPKEAGNYQVDIFDQFDARGLITGADYNDNLKDMVLIGYENFVPFTWLIWDFEDDHFFRGNKRRADFAYIQGAQTEGICFQNDEKILVSCESSFYPTQLYSFSCDQISLTSSDQSEKFTPFNISINPVPSEDIVELKIEGLNMPDFDVELYNLGWQKVQQFSFRESDFSQQVSVNFTSEQLQNGLYFLRVKQGNRIGFRKLFIQKND